MQYSWPGNVRELRNLVERHIALADAPELHLAEPGSPPQLSVGAEMSHERSLDYDQPDLHTLEKRYILKVLDQMGGSRDRTADVLGINKSTLWRKLQQFKSE